MIFLLAGRTSPDTPRGIDNSRAADIPATPADAGRPVVTPVTAAHPCARPPAAALVQVIRAVRDLGMDEGRVKAVAPAGPAGVPVQGQVHLFSTGTLART